MISPLYTRPLYSLSLALFCSFPCHPLVAATSLSQFGITWSFDRDYQSGQYANGDYWVLGPVTIVSITPRSTQVNGRVTNGTMLNPASSFSRTQGLDSALDYLPSLNVARPRDEDLSAANPLIVPPGSSLLSAISNPTAGARPQFTDAAVLTVVEAPPPSGSFRPPYAGNNKTHSWNKASLDYSILRSLPIQPGFPSLSTVERYVARPQIEIHTSAFSQFYHPTNNTPNYGREISWNMATAVLSLHFNYTKAQKERLFIGVVQRGIDIYGCAAYSSGLWLDLDGINSGRKLPLVIAALALNDPNLLEYADARRRFIFSEDRQTWVVTQADVGKSVYTADNRIRETYIQEDVGLPEWGGQHTHANGTRDGRNWETMFYRDICGTSFVGMILAAHLTRGGRAAWNWQPLFDYTDRYMRNPIQGSNAVRQIDAAAWANLRPLVSGPSREPTIEINR